MSVEKEAVFNNIREFVRKETDTVINNHLQNKNYNVNDAQMWTNQICDDVLFSLYRSLKASPQQTKTSSSLPTASSCKKQTAD